MALRAVIAGATGLIGSNLAEHLVSKGWEVYGIARKPQTGIRGIRPVVADLLEPEALRAYGVARKPQTGIPGVRPIEADLLEREALRSSLAGSPGRPIVRHGDTPLNGGHKP